MSGEPPQDYSDLMNSIANELTDPSQICAAARGQCDAVNQSPQESAESDVSSSQLSALPLSPIQASVADIWQELLGSESIGIDDAFLDLGGDSLLAMQILSRVRKRFGVDLPIDLIFENELTIRTLSEWVDLALNKKKAASEGSKAETVG
jgi:acyl carrier protein